MSHYPSTTHKLDVFFDGNCVLCNAEIEMYRKKDKLQKIRWVDISSPYFDAHKLGLNAVEVKRHMHAQSVDGERFVGVDAFVQIWKNIPGYEPLIAIVTNPLLRPAFDFGYKLFAKVRPYLPKKNKNCDNGACDI